MTASKTAIALAFVTSIVLAAACSSEHAPTAPYQGLPDASRSSSTSDDARKSFDLTGQWMYVEEATVSFQAPGTGTATVRCSGLAQGTYDFVQNGESLAGTFVQTGNCTFIDGTVVENPIPGGSIANGVVRNGAVSFEQPGCTYHGALSRDGASIRGNVACKYGKDVKYLGTWTAIRISRARMSSGVV